MPASPASQSHGRRHARRPRLRAGRRRRARRSLTARDSSSLRAGASPSQNGMVGGAPLRVGDADDAGADLQDAPRRVAELEDVAGDALDREVFVQRADERVVGLEDDAVVGDFGDRAAGGRARAAARRGGRGAVPLTSSRWTSARAPAAPRREAVGEHRDDGVEVARVEVAIRPRAPHQREQLVLARIRGTPSRRRSAARARRAARRATTMRSSSPRADRAQQRRAFDEVVARHREQPALRRAGDRVARAADALQQRRDAMRRSDLADQIDVADVDAELERRRGDERLQRARLQPRLGVEPLLLRQAAVMRGDRVLAEALAQVAREPLGQPPRVHEDQRRAVLRDRARRAGRSTPPRPRATSPLRAASPASRAPRSSARRWPSSTIAQSRRGRRRLAVPTRKRATSSIGFCVADRPMRRSGAAATCLRAARATARGARRGACR